MYQNFNLKSNYKEYIISGLFLALGFLIGLGIGKLQNLNGPTPIVIDKNVKIGLPAVRHGLPAGGRVSNKIVNPTGSNFVASINGNAYYPVNCKAAEKIKEENKIWFGSAEEAETQGYKPAQNCR